MRLGYTFIWVDDVERTVTFFERAFGLSRRFVVENGPMHQQRLAGLLGVDRQTLANVAVDLERRGFVERRTASHDRRTLVLTLTADGERAFRTADAAAVAEERQIFQSLAPDELAALYRALRTLAASEHFGGLLRSPADGR